MSPELRRVRQGAVLIGILLVFSVAGHYLIAEPDDPLDSIWWTVITISTVGYGSSPNDAVGSAEKIFTIGIIVVGTIAVGYTVSAFLQAAIEGKIENAMGVRRMTRDISRLSDHVVICGFGRIGQYVAERLGKRNIGVVVIDSNDEAIELAKERGYLCVEGDATSEEALIEAGVNRARTLVVALQSDADNVFLTLSARNLCPELHILARGEQPATEKKLMQAGANEVVLPAVIGAHHIADRITKPHSANLMFGMGQPASMDADIAELQISAHSPLVGKSIRDAGTRKKDDVLIVSIRRPDGEQLFNPNADVRFGANDTLIVIGHADSVRSFKASYGGPEVDDDAAL